MNKSQILAAVLILIAIIGAYLLFFRGYDIKNYPPKSGTNIIAFGDSLTAGVGASQGKDYVTLLSSKLGVQVINKGVSGDTTSNALKRLQDDVFDNDPKLVIVMLGGNDFIRRVGKADVSSNLESIITQIQAKGAIVVLVGVRGGLITDSASDMYEDLAKKTNSAYIDDILGGIYGHSELMSDAIHPNDRGYAIMSDRLYDEIKPLLK